jgi:predicted dehydrogenase
MGDVFPDRLSISLNSLRQHAEVGNRVDVPPAGQFIGFDPYQQVIESGVDVVLLTTPPHFRPMHLRAAIEANKPVFAEKPVAVDPTGVRSVLESTELGLQHRVQFRRHGY